MSQEVLANIMFGIIGLAYFLYMVQEIPTIGVGIFNIFIAKNDEDKKKLQSIAGLYSDGIEVWLIAAVGLTFAAFPEAFGEIYSGIYVAAFLLLIAIIFRGLSVELMFKDDHPKWIKNMSLAWSISGMLLMFVLGVYFVTLFMGFPYENKTMDMNVLSIFNTASVSGGLLFIALGFIIGAVWMKFNKLNELADRAFIFIKKYGIIYFIPLLFALVLMGINNNVVSLVTCQFFSEFSWLFAVPIASLIFFALVTLFAHFKLTPFLYVSYVLGLFTFFLTGFLGTFPYVLFSKEAFSESLSIVQVMSSEMSLTVLFVVIIIILPIVLMYQGHKYIYFLRKDKH